MALAKTLSGPIHHRLSGALFLCCALLGSTAFAASNSDTLARELIELRSVVEELNSDVEDKKEQHKNKMSSLAIQKADLEAEAQRGELRIKQQEAALENARKLAKESSAGADSIPPIVFDAIAVMQSRIEAGLPFKVAERNAALDDIKSKLTAQVISPQKAANRLWAFYDDEIRMTKENGIFRQTIQINGDDHLVDVARLGMVAMYFQTSDGRVGSTNKTTNGWFYLLESSPDKQAQITSLFDDFKKNIRTGYFVIPNTLVTKAH